ncbi:hypothetical protein Ancab_030945 [Ancistrocladus abbreviatus]
MVSPSHPKSPNSLHIFSTKSPSSTMKLKSLVHNLIFSHICRVIRALSKAAKSILLEIFRENPLIFFKGSELMSKNEYRNKVLFGSFRLHYNWCSSSSHVLPMPSPVVEGTVNSKQTQHLYYDSTWNSSFSTEDDHCCNSDSNKEEAELSSYLQWLEEKGDVSGEDDVVNEIDRLADMFIANCHEKFRLEKIESYRRYQEMLARSM